jgi:hypothetical protein
MSQAKQDVAEQLTQVRLELDALIRAMKLSDPKFMAALLKANLCFMWLGKAKGEMGVEYPYPQSTNPESPIIEPPQDVSQKPIVTWPTEIASVKYLRQELATVIRAVKSVMRTMPDDKFFQICLNQAYVYACESKMHLGQILGQNYSPPTKKESVKKKPSAAKKK